MKARPGSGLVNFFCLFCFALVSFSSMDLFSLEKNSLKEWVLCLQISQEPAWEQVEEVSRRPPEGGARAPSRSEGSGRGHREATPGRK